MDKIIFSALLYEAYQEILFITYNYQKELISDAEIRKMTDSDFEALGKSKVLYSFYNRYLELQKEGMDEYIDNDFMSILESRKYDAKRLTYMISYLNEYASIYVDYFHKFTDKIAEVMDIKMNELGLKGEYPLYIKIESSKAILKRAVITSNASLYLENKTKHFGFKITYIDYDVPLKDYSFNGIDLREKTKKEIIDIMDSSVKVNMQHAEYFDTEIIEYRPELDYTTGEISLMLDKKRKQSGVKEAMKSALKGALISFLIFAAFVTVFLIFKYLIK